MISVPQQLKVANRAGFTLIEMAIVLVIVGIIVSIVASVLPSLIQSGKIKKAQAMLEDADRAIRGYSIVQYRLPYADSGSDGNEDTGVYVGNLPYRTLGLFSGNDAWGNSIKYGVYEDLTTTTSTNFCTTLSTITSYSDSAKVHTTDETTSQVTNQSFVIVSGGEKDLDGDSADGFFDGLNEGSNVQFDNPAKTPYHGDPASSRYDDLMRAFSLSQLVEKNCTSSTSSTTSETCDNGTDDDGDGYIDCDDQDCYGVDPCGAGGENVVITTSSLSSGVVNSSYSATIQATGGITPYEWTLDVDGGFTDFFLHTYTGQLSGTLDQCPGTYTIDVSVEDSTLVADDGPKTDTASLSLQVTTDLVVSRTSGSGTNITWNSPAQQETFQTTGGHLGDIDWTLSTGGATGFTVSSSGNDTCTIEKNGSSTAGTYTFTLTGTDSSCSSNTDQIILSVTVTSSGSDAPYTVEMEGEWRFDECSAWDGTSYDVVDSLGDANHYGKAINGVTGTHSGKVCRAASFDGSNDMIVSDILTGSDIMVFNDEVTLSCWFKSSGGGKGAPRLIEFSNDTGSYSYSTALCYDTDGDLRAWVTAESTTTRGGEIDYAGKYTDNKWHHVVYTYSSTNGGRLYVDNVLKQTATDNPTSNIWDAETFSIGGLYENTDHVYEGFIDDVMVYSRELTADDITDLYELTRSCSGTCYVDPVAEYHMDETTWSGVSVADSSANGYHGTAQHDADTTSLGKLCRGGAFTDSGDDDINDRVKIPYQVANGLGDFTVAAWIKTGMSGQQAVISGANNSQSNEFLLFLPNSTTIRPYFKGGSNSYSTASLADSTWHHIVWLRDDDQETIYLDGESLGTNSTSGSAVNVSSNGLWLGSEQDSVGGGWDSGQEFVGTMDEVYVYDRALSDSEINALKETERTCN